MDNVLICQFLEFIVRIIASGKFLKLLTDSLELLTQVVLALVLLHLAVDFRLNLIMHLLHGELLLQNCQDLHYPLLCIKGFKEGLLVLTGNNHAGKVVCKPYGFLDVCCIELQIVQKGRAVLTPCNLIAKGAEVCLVLNRCEGLFLYVLNLGADYALVTEHFKDSESLDGLYVEALCAVERGYLVLDSDKGSHAVKVIGSQLR